MHTDTVLVCVISVPTGAVRLFAVDALRRLIDACASAAEEQHAPHFDLVLARERKASQPTCDLLVLHLAELVRVAFIASSASCDRVRLVGLRLLEEVVRRFAAVPEPEFAGHRLLEQYAAQVGAALRPAFAPDTAPQVRVYCT